MDYLFCFCTDYSVCLVPKGCHGRIDFSYNNVKCGFELLNEIGLALEKCRANRI